MTHYTRHKAGMLAAALIIHRTPGQPRGGDRPQTSGCFEECC